MEVIVWLGPDTHHLAQALSRTLRSKLKCEHSEPLDHDLIRLLPGLLQSDWFCRLWVVQEYCLGREVVFMWGSTSISATPLSQFVGELGPAGLSSKSHSWFTDRISLDHFLGAVQAARSLSCSDDRDRIYGLLGLRYNPNLPITKALRALEPDYSKPVEHLFMHVACLCLEHDQGAVLFGQVDGSPDGTNGLPSWIPDWRIPSQVTPLFDSDLLDQYSPLLHPRASTVAVHRESGTLFMKGIAFSRVHSLIPTMLDTECAMKTMKAIANYWRKTLGSLRKHYSEEVDYAEAELAFACLFIDADKINEAANTGENLELDDIFPEGIPESIRGRSEENLKYLDLSLENTQTLEDMLLSINQSICIAKQNADLYRPGILQPHSWTPACWRGRRLFQTQDGLMGLGPGELRANDEVVLLSSHGRAIPAVLRRKGNHLTLVGIAFIPALWKYDQHVSSEDLWMDALRCCSRGGGHHTGYDHYFFDKVEEATDYTLK